MAVDRRDERFTTYENNKVYFLVVNIQKQFTLAKVFIYALLLLGGWKTWVSSQ